MKQIFYWECDCIFDRIHSSKELVCKRCDTPLSDSIELTFFEALIIDPTIKNEKEEAGQ